jgi:hypothetical protein
MYCKGLERLSLYKFSSTSNMMCQVMTRLPVQFGNLPVILVKQQQNILFSPLTKLSLTTILNNGSCRKYTVLYVFFFIILDLTVLREAQYTVCTV